MAACSSHRRTTCKLGVSDRFPDLQKFQHIAAAKREGKFSWLFFWIANFTFHYVNQRSLFTKSSQTGLMEMLFKTPFDGGIISCGKEKWSYSREGLLKNLAGAPGLEFAWNGETLTDISSSGSSPNGSGIWNTGIFWSIHSCKCIKMNWNELC